MITEPKRIRVQPNSEVARLLQEAKERPLILESNGETFRLYHEEAGDLWTGYDPKAVIDAITFTAGSWSDIDVEEMLTQLYQAREQGSRPPSRP